MPTRVRARLDPVIGAARDRVADASGVDVERVDVRAGATSESADDLSDEAAADYRNPVVEADVGDADGMKGYRGDGRQCCCSQRHGVCAPSRRGSLAR